MCIHFKWLTNVSDVILIKKSSNDDHCIIIWWSSYQDEVVENLLESAAVMQWYGVGGGGACNRAWRETGSHDHTSWTPSSLAISGNILKMNKPEKFFLQVFEMSEELQQGSWKNSSYQPPDPRLSGNSLKNDGLKDTKKMARDRFSPSIQFSQSSQSFTYSLIL